MQQTEFLSKVIVTEFNTKYKTQDTEKKKERILRTKIQGINLCGSVSDCMQLSPVDEKDMFTLSPDITNSSLPLFNLIKVVGRQQLDLEDQVTAFAVNRQNWGNQLS